MAERGLFFMFEGCDGVGKTLHAQRLLEYIKSIGQEAIFVKGIGESSLGEYVKHCLVNEDLEPMTEVLLLFASRYETHINYIRPALLNGVHVICDRGDDSTLVYQGHLRKIKWHDIMTIKRIVFGNIEPDVTFLLHCNAATIMQRVSERGKKDKYDLCDIAMYESIQECFHLAAKIFFYRYHTINTEKPISTTHQSVMKIFHETLEKQRRGETNINIDIDTGH